MTAGNTCFVPAGQFKNPRNGGEAIEAMAGVAQLASAAHSGLLDPGVQDAIAALAAKVIKKLAEAAIKKAIVHFTSVTASAVSAAAGPVGWVITVVQWYGDAIISAVDAKHKVDEGFRYAKKPVDLKRMLIQPNGAEDAIRFWALATENLEDEQPDPTTLNAVKAQAKKAQKAMQ